MTTLGPADYNGLFASKEAVCLECILPTFSIIIIPH